MARKHTAQTADGDREGLLTPPLTGELAPIDEKHAVVSSSPAATTESASDKPQLDSLRLPGPALAPAPGPTASGTGAKRGRRSTAGDKDAAEQRRKARRTSHSDIERRRRLKINEQFELLRSLVPSCSHMNTAKRGGEVGLHKLDILTESVQYIFELKGRLSALEQQAFGVPPGSGPVSRAAHPSATAHNSMPPPSSSQPVSGTSTPVTSPPTPPLGPSADTAKLRIANLLG